MAGLMKKTQEAQNPRGVDEASSLSDWNMTVITLSVDVIFGGA